MVEMRNLFKILVRKREGNLPLGSHRHRWEDIRMDLKEMEWEGVNWINFAEDGDQSQTLVNTIVDHEGEEFID
jgi:hypothetical protein